MQVRKRGRRRDAAAADAAACLPACSRDRSDASLGCAGLLTPAPPFDYAEPEAVDLLLELDSISRLVAHIDAGNAPRTCRYLLACAGYLPEPEDAAALRAAHDGYAKAGRAPDALRVALRMRDEGLVAAAFALAGEDKGLRRQLAHVLAAAGEGIDLEAGPAAVADEAERDALREILRRASCRLACSGRLACLWAYLTRAPAGVPCPCRRSNTRLSERYLALARDLDVVEARTPEDVYKMHLVEGRATGARAASCAALPLSCRLARCRCTVRCYSARR
jgi:26S proteasome regulatory subunit N1